MPLPDLHTLNQQVARGETTHEALLDRVLERAARPEAAHTFTRLYPEAARAAARWADASRGAGVPLGPLAGLAGDGEGPVRRRR
jgi:aspartyl-tRNA(Asn)/glutamyl-tRNA(Gln) amidotransferase subunit A